ALESAGLVRRPVVPRECDHNAHIYYLLMRNLDDRCQFIANLKQQGIHTVFHYVPLHSSPQGIRIGRVAGPMSVTESVSERLVRLPLWPGLEEVQDEVISRIIAIAEALP
ncbi:MAG: DegT/DnrJ/EryC1/StrS family aminotransferase, partial [Gemmatimonadales bacterium]